MAEGTTAPGFDIHMIMNLKIGEFFDFRFLPGFSLAERNIVFSRPDSEVTGINPRRKIST